MRGFLTAAFAAACVLAAPVVGAQESANEKLFKNCSQNVDIDAKIAACSRILLVRATDKNAVVRAVGFANRAGGHNAKGNYDQAIADAAEAIRLDPNDPLAYNNRGAAFLGKNDSTAAIADFDQAIRLNPNAATSYVNRGVAYNKAGQYDRAIVDLNEAIRINPKLANPYRHRAASHQGKRDFDQALKDYGQALQLNPAYADALNGRASLHAARDEPEKALADYGTASKLPAQANVRREIEEGERTARAALEARKDSTKKAPLRPDLSANETRVALVVGNSTYASQPALPNPRRDAEAIAQALRGSNFKVTLAFDMTRAQFIDALNAFADKASQADWALIYFAGHGLEVDRVNYALPVDVRLRRDRDAQDEAVPLERILQAVEQARKMRLVVLDACRNNPFISTMERAGGRSRSASRGLARVEPAAGSLVAFAAREGQEAQDGNEGENSPFAAALSRRMNEGGHEIGLLFRLVRDDVLEATNRQQEPFTYGSLPGETFFFRRASN